MIKKKTTDKNTRKITSVKTLANHSDVSMTARYYNENENMLKNVVNSLKI